LLTPVCRIVATRRGYVATPRADRWHAKPTALLGGVSIVAVTLVFGATLDLRGYVPALIGASLLIAGFGLVDDLVPLKASTKLIAQIVVASILLFFGLRLHWTTSMVGDAMLTMFWIVGVTNAFNLLDNMDGLCAGTALIAGACLLIRMLGGDD